MEGYPYSLNRYGWIDKQVSDEMKTIRPSASFVDMREHFYGANRDNAKVFQMGAEMIEVINDGLKVYADPTLFPNPYVHGTGGQPAISNVNYYPLVRHFPMFDLSSDGTMYESDYRGQQNATTNDRYKGFTGSCYYNPTPLHPSRLWGFLTFDNGNEIANMNWCQSAESHTLWFGVHNGITNFMNDHDPENDTTNYFDNIINDNTLRLPYLANNEEVVYYVKLSPPRESGSVQTNSYAQLSPTDFTPLRTGSGIDNINTFFGDDLVVSQITAYKGGYETTSRTPTANNGNALVSTPPLMYVRGVVNRNPVTDNDEPFLLEKYLSVDLLFNSESTPFFTGTVSAFSGEGGVAPWAFPVAMVRKGLLNNLYVTRRNSFIGTNGVPMGNLTAGGTEAQYRYIFDQLGMKVTFIENEATSVPLSQWSTIPEEPELPDTATGHERPVMPETGTRPEEGEGDNNGSGDFEGGHVDNTTVTNPTSQSQVIQGGSIYASNHRPYKQWLVDDTNLYYLQASLISPTITDLFHNSLYGVNGAIKNILYFPFNVEDIDPHVLSPTDIQIRVLDQEMKGNLKDEILAENQIVSAMGRQVVGMMRNKFVVARHNFSPFFGSFLDYEPYTNIKVVLPYVGEVAINPRDVIGSQLVISYSISWDDGSCLAILEVGDKVIATAQGQAGTDVSLIEQDILKGMMSIASSLIPSLNGSKLVNSSFFQLGTTTLNTLANSSFNFKNGSAPVNHAMTLPPKPYIMIERPRTNMIDNQTYLRGFPTYIYRQLSTLRGYTECSNVKLNNFQVATQDELNRVRALLESGIILGGDLNG